MRRRAIADADGKAFRDMVQRHGGHKQRAAPPAGINPFDGILHGVQVRQHLVQPEEKGRAQRQPADNGQEGKAAEMFRHFQGGRKQPQRGGCKHHAAGRAEQAVHQEAGKVLAGKDQCRARADGEPCQRSRAEGLYRRMVKNHVCYLLYRPERFKPYGL